MNGSIPLGLATIVVAGALAQWLGWRLRLPAILLLLVFGFLAGPEVTGLVRPDAMFGDLLLPVVSISVAILLFEGSLTLQLRELGAARAVVGKLLTLGAGISWVLTAAAAYVLLDFPLVLAILVGAILVVTGPTVVGPLLRQVRPTGVAGSVLKWEGILIDPVGAVLAVLVFEVIVAGGGLRPALGLAAAGILKTIVAGTVIAILAAGLLLLALRRFWVPDHLHSPVALALAVGAYAATNALQHEGGLFTVTLLGAILANQRTVEIGHILEFKENLRVLIISTLFILLAARVQVADLQTLDVGALLFLALLIVVIRPVSAAACTAGSRIDRAGRIFIAGLAPRGVVAAAVTSVFALRLEADYPAARQLVPLVFFVIVGTVAIYGLGAGPLAYRLGIAKPKPQGALLVGAHRFARALAETLNELGLRVLLVDTNALYIARARMMGLEVHHGSAVSELVDEELDLAGIGRLLAMTPNDEINSLCAIHYVPLFGRGEVYQLPAHKGTVARTLRGRVLFGEECTYNRMDERLVGGATVKATPLTEQFGFEEWREEHGEKAIPLMALSENGTLVIGTIEKPLAPVAGQTLIALVDPDGESA